MNDMKINIFKLIFAISILAVGITSCSKKLDYYLSMTLLPNRCTQHQKAINRHWQKVYGSFATTGNSGPSGNNDLQGVPDEGNYADFFRTFCIRRS
jgi:hypothetical protein